MQTVFKYSSSAQSQTFAFTFPSFICTNKVWAPTERVFYLNFLTFHPRESPRVSFHPLDTLPPLLIILPTPTFFPNFTSTLSLLSLSSIINLAEWVYSKLGVKVISSPFLLREFYHKNRLKCSRFCTSKVLANILSSRNILNFWLRDETGCLWSKISFDHVDIFIAKYNLGIFFSK